MKLTVLLGGFFIASGVSLVQAGSVFVLGNGPGARGTLTLNATAIHVEGGSAANINLSDVLEADFGEAPFQLNYFTTASGAAQMPANWKGEDIGHPALPGSCAYADGAITLTGAGVALQRKEKEDQYFVFGRPWTGDVQLTARLKEVDAATYSGPMLRDSLDPLSNLFAMGITGGGGGLFLSRAESRAHVGWNAFSLDALPVWVRLVRCGESIDSATSSDGLKWEIINQGRFKASSDSWLGFFLSGGSEKKIGKAVWDQLTIAPGPAEPETIPPGVLLRSGSFLTGTFRTRDPQSGSLERNGKKIALTTDQIAAVILHPVTRRQLADVGAQTGLIMKNGDFLAADIQSMNGASISVNSLLLGIVSYSDDAVRACILQAVQSLPSDYEIRLRDGSILRATSLSAGGGQAVIGEVSGVSVEASVDEIAQIRAGLSRAQTLIDLPWKVTAPLVAKTPQATNAATEVIAAPAIPTDKNADVQCWAGPNQEQILAVPAGTPLEFPMPGKCSALAMKIALAPDAPPNAQTVVRILADGKEIAHTPVFKAGDQPGFVEVTLQSPKIVTIVADSTFAGTKTLLIDPVVIR